MRWSERANPNLTPNRLTETIRAVRAAGGPIIDLTVSNPTQAGFDYPVDLLAMLADRRALTYQPHPLGLPAARDAVAADYARRGLSITSDRIVLTASTSEAYSVLFKLLCDPGDEVLVPHPSYPLFEHLARLDGVIHRAYELEYLPTLWEPASAGSGPPEGGRHRMRWSIDFESVERAWSPRTKAVLAVSPNNPTGSFVSGDDLVRLEALASARGAALIVDEVFADYELTPGAAASSACPERSRRVIVDERRTLTFSLGGLSKSIGLPQAKLAWIAAAGPDAIVDAAIARLELIADTYLSVSTSVQIAAADLMARGAPVRAQIHERVRRNYRHLLGRSGDVTSCNVLHADGGWYAVLRVPSIESEEDLVVSLLAHDGVLTHPGYFFDFPSESYLVISLIVPERAFADGVARVLRHFDCTVAQP